MIPIQTASNIFDLSLNMGKYQCQYSANGAIMMLNSSMGHTALMKFR